MTVLVTGAIGFIGSHVVPKLLKAGYQVVGFDNVSNPSLNPTDRMKQEAGDKWSNFTFWEGDIREFNTLKSVCINHGVQYIVHLAALGSVPRSFEKPGEVIDVNERGFSNVMQISHGLGIKRVVFASSSSVYGNSPYSVKSEGAEGAPLSPYALTKIHNESFARIWCSGSPLEYIGLRFFNVYGPGQNFESGYSAVIPRFINGNSIVIHGDGETTRDFTYVEDVAQSVLQALSCEGKNFICNVGTGEGTSLNHLAEIVCSTAGTKEIKHVIERPMDIRHSVADINRLRDRLNFTPAFSIRQGIEKTYDYYRGLKR